MDPTRRLPPTHPPRPPRWRPDDVRQWLDTHEPHLSLARVAEHIGATPHALKSRRRRGQFPPPDGHHGNRPWWTHATLHQWLANRTHGRTPWGTHHALTHTTMTPTDLEILRSHLGPPPWKPTEVKTWWRSRARELREDPQVLFGRDVAEVTGLSWDTVRTYRRRGEMPEPDGWHQSRPWWRRQTIVEWDAARRATIRTGRPRRGVAAALA